MIVRNPYSTINLLFFTLQHLGCYLVQQNTHAVAMSKNIMSIIFKIGFGSVFINLLNKLLKLFPLQKRMWRKTRSPSKNSHCRGVDGNRNFGYKWGEFDAVTDPCNFGTYIGPSAFSEAETIIVRKVMDQHVDRIKLYISLHSYGQMILYPWGWTDLKTKDYDKVHSLGTKAERAMVQAGADPFEVKCAAELYLTSGSSLDYAYKIGITYSYGIELTDGYEFDFPESKLSSVLPPFYKGIQTFAEQLRKEHKVH